MKINVDKSPFIPNNGAMKINNKGSVQPASINSIRFQFMIYLLS